MTTPEHRIQFQYEDVGFCRLMYQSVVSKRWYCFQEECGDHWLFYSCTDDEEPITTHTPPQYLIDDLLERKPDAKLGW